MGDEQMEMHEMQRNLDEQAEQMASSSKAKHDAQKAAIWNVIRNLEERHQQNDQNVLHSQEMGSTRTENVEANNQELPDDENIAKRFRIVTTFVLIMTLFITSNIPLGEECFLSYTKSFHEYVVGFLYFAIVLVAYKKIRLIASTLNIVTVLLPYVVLALSLIILSDFYTDESHNMNSLEQSVVVIRILTPPILVMLDFIFLFRIVREIHFPMFLLLVLVTFNFAIAVREFIPDLVQPDPERKEIILAYFILSVVLLMVEGFMLAMA